MALKSLRRRTFGVGVLAYFVTLIAAALLFFWPPILAFYETLESFVHHLIFVSTATPSQHLVIVEEGEVPLDRPTYGRLIKKLESLDAAVIALDVLFYQPGDSEQNAELIAATRKTAGKTIHAMEFIESENRDNRTVMPDRFHLDIQFDSKKCLSEVRDHKLPFPELLRATEHLASITGTVGITLRDSQFFPLLVCFNDRLYPSLPLQAAIRFVATATDTLAGPHESNNRPSPNLAIADPLSFPLGARSRVPINFIPLDAFDGKRFTIRQVLAFTAEQKSKIENRIVLIGNTQDSQEKTFGPRFETYPSLMVHATLISQLLNGQAIEEGHINSFALGLFMLIAVIGGIVSLSERLERVRTWQMCLGALVLIILAAFIAYHFSVRNMVVLPWLAFCTGYGVARSYFTKQMNGLFGRQAQLSYEDFYLVISPSRDDDGRYPVVLIDSPAGEDFGELNIEKPKQIYDRLIQRMSEEIRVDPRVLKEFGAALFDQLFRARIGDRFDRSIGMVSASRAALRIKLRIDAPELAAYPWEYLFDGRDAGQFLALHPQISVARFLAIQEPLPAVRLKPPLRLLVVISNPTDAPSLRVEEEKEKIRVSLADLMAGGMIRIRFLTPATLAGLQSELRRRVDMIHFIGHGVFSENRGGCLLFEDENRMRELVNVDRLSTLLQGQSVRLAILNACQTAQTSSTQASIGVAQGLVSKGIPAVIAMQFKLPDDSAVEFSRVFYATLANTLQVDRALNEARRNIFIHLDDDYIDWGIPVLFLRKDDGSIFTMA